MVKKANSKHYDIGYAHLDKLNIGAKRVISTEAHHLFPGASLGLVDDPESPLLDPNAIADYPRAELFVQAQLMRMFPETDMGVFSDNILFLDIETHNAEKRWDMHLDDFFRLGQYAWGEGPVQLTEDLDVVLGVIERADKVVAHNGHSFDFSVLLGDAALDLAFEGKLFDTYTFAQLNFPCPVVYTHANGTTYRNNTAPAQFRRWYGLDNLAYQFGAARKFGDLAKLAAKHNPKGTTRDNLDFGLIPLDDVDFLEYAKQDIVALRELTRSMLAVTGIDDYDRRCQITAALDAQMSRNGVLVDVDEAQRRVDEAERVKQEILGKLEEEYGFPTEGKMPWRTSAGKAAIEKLLADAGIDIHADSWPKTATGNPSLGGDALISGTEGTSAESLGQSLAVLQGQRPLAAQALQYTYGDGRIHPDIDGLQVTGRRSTTKPGLTTFGKKEDKQFFIADPGMVMMEFDLDAADARGVAALSGDPNLVKQYTEGVDGHEFVGRAVYGDEEYEAHMLPGWEHDPEIRKANPLRKKSKPLGHGYSYGSGAKNLSRVAGVPLEEAQRFVDTQKKLFPVRESWFARVREEAMQQGYITNLWGRTIFISIDRAHTQAPAMHGQSFTSEMIEDWLIKMYKNAPEIMKWLCFGIHDALLIQLPKDRVEYYTELILDFAKRTINGVPMRAAKGHPAANWGDCAH